MVNLDDITEFEDARVFKIESQSNLSYEKDYVAQMTVTIERNMDLKVIARQGYTVLDYISDLGGMQGILISSMAWLIAVWNYNKFDNHMVSRLFKVEKSNPEERADF